VIPVPDTTTRTDTRTVSVSRLRERSANLLPVIAEGAAERARRGQSLDPQIRRIAEQGLCTFRVPARFGGPGSSVQDVIGFVVDLAAADSAIAQALRPRFGFVEAMLTHGSSEQQQRCFPLVLAGNLVDEPDEEVPHGNGTRPSPVTGFLGLYRAAVLAGTTRGAMTDIVTFLRDRARAEGRGTATGDPRVRHTVGEISSYAYAAEAVVTRAAAALDRAWAADLRPNLVTAAAVQVTQARYVAASSALQAGELVVHATGAVAYDLDRHRVTARAATSDRAQSQDATTIGAYRLCGAEPTTDDLF
jgi:alkylation response protein AidB-like acyl-CoA dehydrogenase